MKLIKEKPISPGLMRYYEDDAGAVHVTLEIDGIVCPGRVIAADDPLFEPADLVYALTIEGRAPHFLGFGGAA